MNQQRLERVPGSPSVIQAVLGLTLVNPVERWSAIFSSRVRPVKAVGRRGATRMGGQMPKCSARGDSLFGAVLPACEPEERRAT